MSTSIIDVPLPPGYGLGNVSQALDKRVEVVVGLSTTPWILSSSGYYYYDIVHNFDSIDITHECYKQDEQKSTVYPGVKRLDNNTARIFWNQQTVVKVILFRVGKAFL